MKKFLSLVLALVMTMSLVTISAGAEDFTDAEDVAYTEAVEVLTATGIISGYTDGSFRPDVQLNRGQAAKIICNLILGPTTSAALPTNVAPYSDVAAGSTFAGYIAYCAKEGIISGYADGTFKPGAPLTGYAFMKMLLGVLGYDASIEGYVGSNWAVSVAKQALAVGLADDLTSDFLGTKTVTRQEAMLYAFNALKAEAVEYDNHTSVTVGDVTFSTQSEAQESGYPYLYDLFDGDLDWDYVRDAYGRPATLWELDNETIGVYSFAPEATYTNNAKLYQIKKDLGLKDSVSFYWSENLQGSFDHGTTRVTQNFAGSVINSSSDKKINDLVNKAGNGVTVEVFYDKDMGSWYQTIVFIEEYWEEIDDVDTDDDGRYIEINGDKFYTDLFEEDQAVLVTYGDDDGPAIISVAAAEKKTGTITRIEKVDGDETYFYIDGVSYELSKNVGKDSVVVGDTVDYYLDSAGYVIEMRISSLSAALEDLAVVYNKTNADVGAWQVLGKVVYGNGKTEVVTLNKADTTLNKVYNFTNASGKLKVEANTGYTSTYTASTTSYVKGTPSAFGVNMDNNTTVIFLDTAKDSATSYTGYKNVPNFTSCAGYVTYKKTTPAGSAALLVVVYDAAGITNSTTELTYVIADDEVMITEKNADGDRYSFYEVKTLAGKTLKVDLATMTNIVAKEDNGVALFDTYSVDGNGVIDSAAVYAGSDVGYLSVTADTGVVEAKNGVLFVNGSAYAVLDDAVVYIIAGDAESFVEGDLKDIVDNAGKYAGATIVKNDDGIVKTVILKKA